MLYMDQLKWKYYILNNIHTYRYTQRIITSFHYAFLILCKDHKDLLYVICYTVCYN